MVARLRSSSKSNKIEGGDKIPTKKNQNSIETTHSKESHAAKTYVGRDQQQSISIKSMKTIKSYCQLPDRIYHMAEATNWNSIKLNGLYSTSTLLDQAGLINCSERDEYEKNQRPTNIILPNGVEIRDQIRIPASALETCLIDMTPTEWYQYSNARIFFWLDPLRVQRHRNACMTRGQVVLTIDTATFVDTYRDNIFVTPINSGNATRRPARRGKGTFVPYHDYIQNGWFSETSSLNNLSERKRSHKPVELTVVGAIPDILQYVVNTCHLQPGESFVQ
jgi:hypothetical protein